MLQRKLKVLFPIGLLMLSGGLILHNWAHGNYTSFASGFLIGISLVFLIASVLSRSRSLRE